MSTIIFMKDNINFLKGRFNLNKNILRNENIMKIYVMICDYLC